jgi:hypothetical protein
MTAGDRLLQPLAEATQAELASGSGLVVEIRRSALGDDAVLAGAGAFAVATGAAGAAGATGAAGALAGAAPA